MPVSRAFLLVLGVALGSFLLGDFFDFPSNSLSYFYLQLPEPSQGLPKFIIRTYLDGQLIAHFNSLTRKMEPLVPWIEEAEKERFLAPEWVFRADLKKISKLNHQAGGFHTWQAVVGCEMMNNVSKGGFFYYGYNGEEFISFNKENLTWVAAQPQAQKVKEEWEKDARWSKSNKFFLEKTCIKELQRYLSYKNVTQERIEPPVGKVTRKVMDDNLEVLICQAFGFDPKEIQATWMRDGEVCQNETIQRNVAPNSDGTYYVQLSIEIDPKERHHFWCHLEHESLQEPLVLAWEEKTAIMSVDFVGVVMIIILASGIHFCICYELICRKKYHRTIITIPDHLPLEKVCASPFYGTEDEIQSQAMLPPKVIPEGCCGQKTKLREGEERPLKASPDAYSDKVEGATQGTSEWGPEELLKAAKATKPGMEWLEEDVYLREVLSGTSG